MCPILGHFRVGERITPGFMSYASGTYFANLPVLKQKYFIPPFRLISNLSSLWRETL